MKNLTLFIAAASLSMTAYAQKIKEDAVPKEVKGAFMKAYPNSKAKSWENEHGNFEAEFDLNKSEMSVVISPSGKIMETETEINVTELPKAVTDYCAKNYAGKKIAEASKIVNEAGATTYEAEINKMDVLFDADGKFIKESKDND